MSRPKQPKREQPRGLAAHRKKIADEKWRTPEALIASWPKAALERIADAIERIATQLEEHSRIMVIRCPKANRIERSEEGGAG